MGNLNVMKTNAMNQNEEDELRGARRRSGVSLIEVVIALSILGFGMLGVAAAQIAAFRSADVSRERIVAHSLARQQLEAFQAMSTTSLEAVMNNGVSVNDALNPIDPDPNDGHTLTYNRSWTVTRDTPEDDVYTVMVTVAWTSVQGAQTVSLETMKSEF
jgi:prepilin-type N-terminal cleavage/methylation domain-containing protein